MDNDKNLVAIYCRLSKEDTREGESESIQNQKSMLINYCLGQKWDIYKIYADDDYSGVDADRPEFSMMIKDAEDRKFNILLCKTQSRFSRDMAVIEQYIHSRFIEWGIRFISVVDNADTSNRGNKKARQINSLINEWYLEDLSDNIREVFKDKMKRGEYIATFAPYGYKKDTDNKNHLIIDEAATEIVRMIYGWHFEGYGAQKMARMLNEMGVPNPRKYQELSGLRKTRMYADNEPGLWSATSIGDILHNQTYCGDTVQNVYRRVSYKDKKVIKNDRKDWIVVPNAHSPIIDRNDFEKAQRNLSAKRRATGIGEVHMFAGKVICHYCKKIMQKNHSVSSSAGKVEYLRCRKKYSIPSGMKCLTPNIRLNILENAVKNQLDELVKEYLCANPNKFLPAPDNNKKLEDIEKKLRDLKLQLSKAENVIRELYKDKVGGVITNEQFAEFNRDFNNEKKELESRIGVCVARLSEFRNETQKRVEAKESLENFMKNKTFTRALIDELIDYIEVGRIDEETGEIIIDIHWNF